MYKLCIQPGHINIRYNCNPTLRTHTGAPDEQELTLRIANRLCEILRSKGFEVQQTDANANCDPIVCRADWDLFLALHGDADYANDNGGGFLDYADPSIDVSTVESQRITRAIESEYFKHSEIANTPHSNFNTRFYYMWQVLTDNTPCVLIELGQVQDPHDRVLLADTERICNALARGICTAFNVSFDPPVVTPPLPTVPDCEFYVTAIKIIKIIIAGKGWPWTKMNKIKEVLKQANV